VEYQNLVGQPKRLTDGKRVVLKLQSKNAKKIEGKIAKKNIKKR